LRPLVVVMPLRGREVLARHSFAPGLEPIVVFYCLVASNAA